MSDLEKVEGALKRLHPRRDVYLVKPPSEGASQEEPSEAAPIEQRNGPTLPVLLTARTRTSPTPQSFERYRHRMPSSQPPSIPALPAPYKPPVVECICQGLGFTRKDLPVGHPEFGKLQPCSCTIRRRITLFKGAQIPEEFQDRSFESYLEQDLDQLQEEMAIQIMRFMMERLTGVYVGHKRGLYLYGPWGVGKSGLAIAALREAIAAGKSGFYLSTAALLDTLRESIAASQRLARGYGDKEDKEEESAGAKVLRLVESVEWLVLDDLGVECGTEFVINRLYRIIEGRRLQRSLYTIFTSNKDASGLEQRWRPTKGGAFDDCFRVIDRLGEYCVTIAMQGRNLRHK